MEWRPKKARLMGQPIVLLFKCSSSGTWCTITNPKQTYNSDFREKRIHQIKMPVIVPSVSKTISAEDIKKINKIKEKLREADRNNDGCYNKEELKTALKNLGAYIPTWRANRCLGKADANNDGQISRSEMETLIDYLLICGFGKKLHTQLSKGRPKKKGSEGVEYSSPSATWTPASFHAPAFVVLHRVLYVRLQVLAFLVVVMFLPWKLLCIVVGNVVGLISTATGKEGPLNSEHKESVTKVA
ncbi:hypothetical protein VNO77_32575 [Canavalia gladiata]|uniref:EF-hand domain-containing protein n=1 Tax=Canavalia gladiata TaxID=3824 RepID=A0AAN9KSS4_CANGL